MDNGVTSNLQIRQLLYCQNKEFWRERNQNRNGRNIKTKKVERKKKPDGGTQLI